MDLILPSSEMDWVAKLTSEPWTGAQEQIAELYRELGPIIYRQCVALLRDREEAKDATHEVFVKLASKPRLGDREHAAAWVYQVATRHCLNLLRDAGRRRGKLSQVALDVAPSVTPEVYPARQITQQVLAHFDETTCTVAVGVLVDDIEQTELAVLLGVSRRTVVRKLAHFLQKARTLVEGER